MKHILLNYCFIYTRRKKQSPPVNYSYDKVHGAWISNMDKHLLVHNKNYPSIASKKRDVETGEDEKGQ